MAGAIYFDYGGQEGLSEQMAFNVQTPFVVRKGVCTCKVVLEEASTPGRGNSKCSEKVFDG